MNNWTVTINNGRATENTQEAYAWEAIYDVAHALDEQRLDMFNYYWRGLTDISHYETDRHNDNGMTVYVRRLRND